MAIGSDIVVVNCLTELVIGEMALWSIPVHTANMPVSFISKAYAHAGSGMHIAKAAACVCVLLYCVMGYWDYCLTSDMYFCHSILIDVSQEWWHPIFFSDSCSNFKPLKANIRTLIKLYNRFPKYSLLRIYA